jgi:hypothetical protein
MAGYFTSKNCMRELASAVSKEKPIIALTELEGSHGGLGVEEVNARIAQADGIAVDQWGFKAEDVAEPSTAEWHGVYVWPGSKKLSQELLRFPPIEWNRVFFHKHMHGSLNPLILPSPRVRYRSLSASYVAPDRRAVAAERYWHHICAP